MNRNPRIENRLADCWHPRVLDLSIADDKFYQAGLVDGFAAAIAVLHYGRGVAERNDLCHPDLMPHREWSRRVIKRHLEACE